MLIEKQSFEKAIINVETGFAVQRLENSKKLRLLSYSSELGKRTQLADEQDASKDRTRDASLGAWQSFMKPLRRRRPPKLKQSSGNAELTTQYYMAPDIDKNPCWHPIPQMNNSLPKSVPWKKGTPQNGIKEALSTTVGTLQNPRRQDRSLKLKLHSRRRGRKTRLSPVKKVSLEKLKKF
ncbi:Hypothetical protein NTJ_04505 [Nesidiocoris tenuis]|uniref:Uncharacterized protein n=1 Tax=Nesidiocoris tenuis TaxID=355587 RepID=A0ABN7ALB9_9HEMI|nr:Hypothetical protein NTJ_04505 [Nesidiocoris tenuis]